MEKSVLELKHMYEKCNEKPEHCDFYKPPREKEDIRFGFGPKLPKKHFDCFYTWTSFFENPKKWSFRRCFTSRSTEYNERK